MSNSAPARGQFSFVILGAGRSGTSLLTGLLDAHPKLEVGFERYAISHLMNKKPLAVSTFMEMCSKEASQSTQIWGNKITTEQLQPALEAHQEAVMQAFTALRVIFVLRDGRTCIASKMARAGLSFGIAQERWLYSVQVYELLLAALPQMAVVKYEDLVQQPQHTLENLCQFIEVPFHKKMLRGSANPKLPVEYQHKTINLQKARATEHPPFPTRDIEAALRKLGYISWNIVKVR